MIFLSHNIPLQSSNFNFKGNDVAAFLEKGNKFLQENKYKEALYFFEQAKKHNPDEIKVYKQIAKAHFGLKNYAMAKDNFNKYLEEYPNDIDVIINLGETEKKMGLYNNALSTFKRAYKLDNLNDLAKRSILTTQNDILSIFSFDRAKQEKNDYAQKNLQKALELTSKHLGKKYMKELAGVKFQFGKTSSMGGTENIAQYENAINTITISNSYIYASAEVIAAYIAHETVHAHDNDSFTSITEEQDAYEVATKFWIDNSNKIKDPEMDYAAELYKNSPDALKSRVAEIYKLRDPSIAETSPYHPINNFFHSLNPYNNTKLAGQSLKHYDIIA